MQVLDQWDSIGGEIHSGHPASNERHITERTHRASWHPRVTAVKTVAFEVEYERQAMRSAASGAGTLAGLREHCCRSVRGA